MEAIVQRSGNRLVVQIPQAVAEKANLTDGSPIKLEEANGVITIRLAWPRCRLTGLLAQVKDRDPHGEFDSSKPHGKETI